MRRSVFDTMYTAWYDSPMGRILLASDGDSLAGLWFEGQKYFADTVDEIMEGEVPVLDIARGWLDDYFDGNVPDTDVPVRFDDTPFRLEVWNALREIPYGRTVTYGELASRMTSSSGGMMSARAVGSAVGRNPVSIIVPCHRVVGSNGSLTGYAGGVERKRRLLELEGCLR